jgi:hypothetical protein
LQPASCLNHSLAGSTHGVLAGLEQGHGELRIRLQVRLHGIFELSASLQDLQHRRVLLDRPAASGHDPAVGVLRLGESIPG